MLKTILLIASLLMFSHEKFELRHKKPSNIIYLKPNLTLKDVYTIFRDSINDMTEVFVDEEKKVNHFDFQKFKIIKSKKGKESILVGFKNHQIVSIDNQKIGDCDKFSLYFHHFDEIVLFTISSLNNERFHADFSGFFIFIKSLNKYLFFDIGTNYRNRYFIKKTDWTYIKSISLLDYNLKPLKKIGIKDKSIIYKSSFFHTNIIQERFIICNKECQDNLLKGYDISEKNLENIIDLISSETFCKCGEEKILTPEINNYKCHLSLFTQLIYKELPNFPNILYKKED
ncbi:hypothetical protein [Thermoflexibacter ruber]|uniref:Uncharacterized protein n=1 Tax=Thermoflexibacter ruber TaxID=1003 RepID=A0A1I2K370_9BACT|nr:hypothetical protein [Thermoflexibacter ruber]SFF61665.1 hypothetical protein SAMN04488541_10844 [Thermoflexibacter ruber]